MEVASEITKGVVQVLMVPVKKQLDYLVSYKKYVDDMHTKKKDLDVARLGVESQKKQNRERRLEVPAQVGPWLIEVEHMNEKVAHFPSEVPGCLDLKSRHKLGRKAFKIFKEIESVMGRCPEIQGTELQIPVGRIDSIMASTSKPSSDQNDFHSRELTFMKALEALGPNHSSHMVALCGMGGVGKTTMMKKLKDVVVGKKMFNHYVEAVIGEKTDPIAIQQAVAEYLGISLTETTKPARTDKLRTWFANNSDGGKKKFLVILDDVWQPVDLEDIGLSRFPNQDVDFKVLITSRDQSVCTEMGVKADLVLKVSVLEEAEAHSLFLQFLEPSDDVDPELHKIREEIVRKCCGLPIAIKTMACTLRSKSKDTWKNALSRLQHHDINTIAPTVFQTSYDNLQDEVTKATFLLCGLFPEDFNIPTEDLLRYGWGLKLFKGMDTIREARYKLNSCIERLKHTNLLIEGDNVRHVKMHDLVRAFVLDMFSKAEHASIVNHGSSKPGWPEIENDVSSSCKRISLTCKGMIEFPGEFKFPNVSILKLMHGDTSLKFPRNFYEEMGQLQVISYDHMRYPLLSSSLERSTNLRVLLLHQCSLTFDLSSIGNLPNLEVLSFAGSEFNRRPSIIGNLKKLRVLDVTGCYGLHIDNGVFKNLVRLEELWAFGRGISITGDDFNEGAKHWKNLSALEFEFHKNNAQPKNLSFENLERFKISVGRSLNKEYSMERKYSFENTLKLVTKKGELLESRINELFEKTVVLCLCVDDMNDLEDVGMKSSLCPLSSSFCNVRMLVVSECAELKYLFTLGVANVLSNLEFLVVFNCFAMKELIHVESGGEERVTFPKLISLSLKGLPQLLSLCGNVNVIALPHLMELKIKEIPNITSIYSKNNSATSCFLRGEVLIPKLKRLHIERMENLKEIWPCDFGTSEEVKLREIEVDDCKNLVNLFPCNPMPLLHHLEELTVSDCGSIEVLFNIDLDCIGEQGRTQDFTVGVARESQELRDSRKNKNFENFQKLFHCGRKSQGLPVPPWTPPKPALVGETREEGGTYNLRKINVRGLRKLQEVWRIKGGENNSGIPIRGFQAIESIDIARCNRFRNGYSPTTTNFDMGALTSMSIFNSGEIRRKYGSVESSQGKENTLFPPDLIHSFHNLRDLQLMRYEGVEVIFEMKSTPPSQDNQHRILPNLENMEISNTESMSHVWKCNWNEFLTLHGKTTESTFHNLTTIHLYRCKRIKYLFSPLMAELLSNLKRVHIEDCYGMEEVVSNRDDEYEEKITSTSTSTHTTRTTLFPLLDSLILDDLQNLKCISGGGAKGGNNEISFNSTITTTSFLDQYRFSQGDGVSWSLCQYAREISISYCHAMSSVIPYYAAGQMQKLQVLRIYSCHGMEEVFETKGINKSVIMLELANLKIVTISHCDLLEHIFTLSTLESLIQLEELMIESCKAMKVIVVKAEEHGVEKTTMASSSKVVVFPRLKRIKLIDLQELVAFFLGANEFQWPSLEKVEVDGCPQMKVFTACGSTDLSLKYVGRWSTSFSCLAATSEVIHWS
uniref:NB-ARC domain-containing protein n=1 Tax=Lactuca sativa TaxID=4236 RepID=A0A9R1XSJ4_LACSA|nr:hypothetical protein LSAT_V11C200053000 [Lactuca sativa]